MDDIKPWLDSFIQNALSEDVGSGDHSSMACIPENAESKATLFIKEDGILAGMELAQYIFNHVDPSIRFEALKKDGDTIVKGEAAFYIYGRIRTILMLERLVLNCMQRMSGIATKTAQMVGLLKGTQTKLLDTRKSTPNFRMLEKWAVRIGGGQNHRFGLFDMIMLKDNHIDGAGGIKNAIESTRQYLKENGLDLKIEIETRNLDEVQQVLNIGGVDRIMLDNFDLPTLREAVFFINHKYETEVSGGINESNIRDYALTGVDFISTSLTIHSVKSLDLSLKLTK